MRYLNYDLRPMTDKDIPMVLDIENKCFKHPWAEKDFMYEMHGNKFANTWVLELSNDSLGLRYVCGFVDWWITFDTGTICQIAVHPELQREGLGSMMMKEVLKEAQVKKVTSLTLEVRKSNEKAINFYKKFGFEVSHTKEGYYVDGEDALYMIWEEDKNNENISH